MGAGAAFGELALYGESEEQQRRTASIVAVAQWGKGEGEEERRPQKQLVLARLTRDDYMEVTEHIERSVYKALATPFDERTEDDVELLFEFFEDEEFFFHLQLDGMRRACCRNFVMQRLAASEVLFRERDAAAAFYVLVRGGVRRIKSGEPAQHLRPGASIGEFELLGRTPDERQRLSTAVAGDRDCLLATLTREDFLRVHDHKEVQKWINKFWVLLTHQVDKTGQTTAVRWEAYQDLHLRIAKTIATPFSKKMAAKSAREDWQTDLGRHNKGGSSLNHEQWSNALFELVDVWCQGAHSILMYVEFLRMLFLNITVTYRKKGFQEPQHRMKKVDECECLMSSMDMMRANLKAKYEADERARETARRVAGADIGEVSELMRTSTRRYGAGWLAGQQLSSKLQTVRAMGVTTEQLLGGRDREEIAQQRAEEDRKRRAAAERWRRAEEVATEVEVAHALQGPKHTTGDEESQLSAQQLRQALDALAAEEAELQRLLALGQLSPEGAARACARLAEIASSRTALLAQLALEAPQPVERPQPSVGEALAYEEAALRRQLLSGQLDAASMAAARARLDEIWRRRAELAAEREAALLHWLSALRTRLQAGGFTGVRELAPAVLSLQQLLDHGGQAAAAASSRATTPPDGDETLSRPVAAAAEALLEEMEVALELKRAAEQGLPWAGEQPLRASQAQRRRRRRQVRRLQGVGRSGSGAQQQPAVERLTQAQPLATGVRRQLGMARGPTDGQSSWRADGWPEEMLWKASLCHSCGDAVYVSSCHPAVRQPAERAQSAHQPPADFRQPRHSPSKIQPGTIPASAPEGDTRSPIAGHHSTPVQRRSPSPSALTKPPTHPSPPRRWFELKRGGPALRSSSGGSSSSAAHAPHLAASQHRGMAGGVGMAMVRGASAGGGALSVEWAGGHRAGGGWLPRGRAVGGGGGGVGALSPLRRSHRSGTSYSSERRSSPSSLSTLPSPETRGSDSLGAWTHAALELTRGHNSAALGGPEAFEASPARLADHRAQSPVYTSYRIAGGVYCDGESATGTPPSTPGLPAMGDWSTWRGAVSAWRLRPATADNSGVSLARGLRGTGLRVTGRPSSSKLYTLGFQPTLAQIQRPLY
jgi:CRP-like cAMP-binding protein